MSSTSAAIQVIDFVRAFAMAWKNLSAYPRTHPAVVGSLDAAEKRLNELRGPAGEVTFGIARDALVYGSLTLDTPAAEKLAIDLYARGVAVLRFGNGTTPQELREFLGILAASAPGHESRPIWDLVTEAGIVNINLQPVAYGAVQLSDDLAEDLRREPKESLWEEILRALLEGRQFAEGSTDRATTASVDELSRLLTQYVDATEGAPETTEEHPTFGVRVASRNDRLAALFSFIDTTFGERLRTHSMQGVQHSLEQGVQLLRALAAPIRNVVLAGILRALSAEDSRMETMRRFAAELPNDEVLEALRYLSSMGTLSRHTATLLQSLTLGTEAPAEEEAPAPASGAIAALVRLFGDDDTDRFNPTDHEKLLSSAAIRVPAAGEPEPDAIQRLGNRTETVASAAVRRQLATVLLDLLAAAPADRALDGVLGRIDQLVRRFVEAEAYEDASSLLERLRKTAETAGEGVRIAVLERLRRGCGLSGLAERIQESDPEKMPALRQLIASLGETALYQLLEALAAEDNVGRRRRLFDFLVSLGRQVVPAATFFLRDERWYVVRNMIALLRVLEDRSSLPELRRLAKHEDLRVRLEAIKTLYALDGNVPKGVLDDMFKDPDPMLAQGAVALVGAYKIKEGVDPLLRMLSSYDLLGGARKIRIKAIRALGEIGDPRALPAMDGYFRTSWWPWPAREERLAAWESLAHYPTRARSELVEKGLKSGDGEVRAICAKLIKR
ncbi:MAG TPA: HEAT repeat domain-containing protein [Thermoanaerobaculia bacterium]